MNLREAHDRAVEKLATEYAAKGFQVRKSAALPFSVPSGQRYDADLLAERDGEHHVIEVVLHGVRGEPQARRWEEIAREVRSHPGWHFRIVLVEQEPPAIAEPQRIAAEIENAKLLLERGTTNAALLLAGSAFEASALRRLMAMGASTTSDTPADLVERLVSEGELDQEDFVPLRDAIELRNAVARGHLDAPQSREAVDRLVTSARRLLAAA